MYKFTETSWYDYGVPPVSLIKDFKSLVKSAAASPLLKYAKTKGQEDLHVIALGAYEGTGFNRNLDCFLEHWCEKNAHYFKDADRAVHRHHKNKPSDPKYGNIKCAVYNKPMRRIELVVGLDIDKCADILDMQEKKGSTDWSMASKQAYDVCTWCKHKAKTDKDRCDHIPASLGEINKQGELCGMENPDPHWFEISHVGRRADRIGVGLQKLAGDKVKPYLPSDFLSLYPGFQPVDCITISKSAESKRSILSKLAELEKYIEALTSKKIPQPVAANATEKLAHEVIDDLRSQDPQRLFKVAAEVGIIFSPDNFFSYVFGPRIKTAEIEEIKTVLPGIFTKLANDSELVNSETFAVSPFGNVAIEKKALASLIKTHSLLTPFVAARKLEKISTELQAGEPSTNPAVLALAREYVNYKLAALSHLQDLNKLSEDMLFAVVAQNYVR